ncbi:MAG TPA: alpha/beta fold hydrolase, partial [Candidatus Binatia bacterium]|nr:alpha/beta fold hydrolase [Candidatus Binatia bacterium]
VSLPQRMAAEVMATIFRISFVLAAFLFLVSLCGFYVSIRPPKIISSITPSAYNMQYENVSFKTADGITLRGWHVPSEKKTDKTLILLHGYPADKGDILPALAFLQKNFNLLLFDFRYLGQSDGSYSTAGAKEVEDLLAAIRFLKTRGIADAGVWGFSMGGAVALMAIEKAPEIRAVVAESSYASLSDMALQFFRVRLINYPIAYLIGLWAKIFLGIDLRDASPAERIRSSAIPILITHSSADAVIPFSQAKSLQQALVNNPRAEFWFSEEFAHGQLHGDYQTRLETFFRTNL